MNLNPSQWGPYYWGMLHFMSSTYDNNPNPSVQSVMKTFIQSLPVFLPCKECQDHAFHFIKSKNLNKVVENRKELFTFFFNFHNFVNERLNKPLMEIKTALEKYSIPKEEHHYYNITPDIKTTSVNTEKCLLGTDSINIILFVLGFLTIVYMLTR
jgi:hypothetical protein